MADEVAEARRLLAERTPGEWFYESWMVQTPNRGRVCIVSTKQADGALIAAAPRLLQALLDRLAEAEMKCSGCGHASPFHMDSGDCWFFVGQPENSYCACMGFAQ